MPKRPSTKKEAGKDFIKSKAQKPLFTKETKAEPGSIMKPAKPEAMPDDFGTGDNSVYANGPSEDNSIISNPWFFKERDGTFVTVSEIEKEEYYISFIRDEPFSWELDLPVFSIRVKIQALTPQQARVVDASVRQDVEEKVIPEYPETMAGRLQYYTAMMQIISINDVPYVAGDYKNMSLPFAEQVRILRSEFDERFSRFTFAKWSAIFKLLRTFESKRAICDANVANENFWSRVGSNSFRKPAYAV